MQENNSKLPIITAEERIKETKGITGCIFGKSGIGKTSLLWTLPPESTLFIDLEAGDLAVKNWQGDTIRARTWQECRDFAVFIAGSNLNLKNDQPYSSEHYDYITKRFGSRSSIDKYETIFIDSITVAGRLCLQWCKNQPQALNGSGKYDMRAIYSLHAQEMINWLVHLQHTRDKNIWFIGILDEKLDDFGRRIYVPQIDGSKTALELPGIVDEVITMAEVKNEDGKLYRKLICHTLNEPGYPAKDRSGKLEMIEEPHLGRLMAKIKGVNT